MKKFTLFAGFFSAVFVMAGAYADGIQVASTNRVRNSVYDITYGNPTETLSTSGTTNDYGYRHGTVPQTNKLKAIEGNASAIGTVTDMGANSTTWRSADLTANNYAAINSVNVGSLAATAGTETIKANKANIAVLKRDKLSTAATGNCASGNECGYVTTGDHVNAPLGTTGGGGRTWMKIATAADATSGSGN